MYDHNKLRGKIREKYGSEVKFAKSMGLSQATLSAKLNDKVDFTRTELIKMQELLNISDDEFRGIFFLKD